MNNKINKLRYLYLEDEKDSFYDYMDVFKRVFDKIGIGDNVEPIFSDFENVRALIDIYQDYRSTRTKFTKKPQKILDIINDIIRPKDKDVIYFVDCNWILDYDNNFGMDFMNDFFEDVPRKEIILLTVYRLNYRGDYLEYSFITKNKGEDFETNLKNKILTLNVCTNFSIDDKEDTEPPQPPPPPPPPPEGEGIDPKTTAL